MACPTCGHTMHGIGHGAAIAVLEKLKETWKPTSDFEYGLDEAIEELKEKNPRDFWCPRCGTVRTVTGEHNADTPPMLVERAKAADDARKETHEVLHRPAGDYIAVGVGGWADVRRCIGREKS